MIVRIDRSEGAALANFLESARYALPQASKKVRVYLSRLAADCRSGQVNSQRFHEAFPVVKLVHRTLRTLVARTFCYSRIDRWKRWLLLPALFEFFFFVYPRRFRQNRRLDKVANMLLRLERRCKEGQ